MLWDCIQKSEGVGLRLMVTDSLGPHIVDVHPLRLERAVKGDGSAILDYQKVMGGEKVYTSGKLISLA